MRTKEIPSKYTALNTLDLLVPAVDVRLAQVLGQWQTNRNKVQAHALLCQTVPEFQTAVLASGLQLQGNRAYQSAFGRKLDTLLKRYKANMEQRYARSSRGATAARAASSALASAKPFAGTVVIQQEAPNDQGREAAAPRGASSASAIVNPFSAAGSKSFARLLAERREMASRMQVEANQNSPDGLLASATVNTTSTANPVVAIAAAGRSNVKPPSFAITASRPNHIMSADQLSPYYRDYLIENMALLNQPLPPAAKFFAKKILHDRQATFLDVDFENKLSEKWGLTEHALDKAQFRFVALKLFHRAQEVVVLDLAAKISQESASESEFDPVARALKFMRQLATADPSMTAEPGPLMVLFLQYPEVARRLNGEQIEELKLIIERKKKKAQKLENDLSQKKVADNAAVEARLTQQESHFEFAIKRGATQNVKDDLIQQFATDNAAFEARLTQENSDLMWEAEKDQAILSEQIASVFFRNEPRPSTVMDDSSGKRAREEFDFSGGADSSSGKRARGGFDFSGGADPSSGKRARGGFDFSGGADSSVDENQPVYSQAAGVFGPIGKDV